MTDTERPFRLGVIGCGRIAQVAHLPAIAKLADVELVGVSDPSPTLRDGVAARYRVSAYAESAALLAAGVDGVVIAVPDRLHLPLTEQALSAGAHVLLEKPAAVDGEQAARIVALADAAGRQVQIGAMRRHDPAMHFAREAVGRIGTVLTASFWYRLPTALRRSTEATLFPAMVVDEQVRAGEAEFKADRRSYLLRTHGAHVFDLVQFLLGDVHRAGALLARSGDDLHWQASLDTAAGLATVAITANAHAEYSEGIEVFGTGGVVRVRSFFPFYRRSSQASVFIEDTAAWTAPEYGAVDPYQRQIEAFVRAVRTSTPVDPDARAGLAAVQLIDAVGNSTERDGAWITL